MSDVYLLYIKGTGSLYGVPARNLSEEETLIHGEKRLLDSGLYKLARPKNYGMKYHKKSKNETKDEVNNE